jgi:hypothetical protein
VRTRPYEREAELGAPVLAWLRDQGWEVWEEVQIGRLSPVADIVARRDGLIWIIELKRSLSLAVLGQAWDWQFTSHYASVAVPFTRDSRSRRFAYAVARRFGIGVLRVEAGEVLESQAPAKNRRPIRIELWETLLHDELKHWGAAAGSMSGHWTPFRATERALARYVKEHPGCSLKEAIDNIHTHYHSSATARSALGQWIRKGVITLVRAKKDKGRIALWPAERQGGRSEA